MQMPQMETERLIIRPTREADCPACIDLWTAPEEGKYMLDPPRDKASEEYLSWGKDVEKEEAWYPMVVFHKESGDFLGTCSVMKMEDDKRWDFGYSIKKKYWRQGYGTEMLTKLIEAGKAEGATSFSANIAKENAASNALVKKIGFRVVKDDVVNRKSGTDIFYPEYQYRLDV